MDAALLKYLTGHAGSSFAPALKHVHVYEIDTPAGVARRAQVGNGRYTVDVPTDLPLITVDVDRLCACWEACPATPAISVGETYATVSSGRIRARVPLFEPTAYPRMPPDPETSHTAAGVAALLAELEPFVATDASRPWATSVCLVNGHAYATNNVVIVRAPFPATFGDRQVLIPMSVIDAIKAKGEPVSLGATDSSVTFYFADDVWIRASLVSGEWMTGTADQLIDALPGDWQAIHPELRKALVTAAKLADDRNPVVQFRDGGLALVDGTFEAEELMPVPDEGRVNAKMTALVFSKAGEVQWHTPRPNIHAFRVGSLTGVFGGMR